jgi:SAM-dependent methyltransferase
MIGAKAGDQVLFVGRDHPALAAEVALVTGLNGRTLALAPVALQPQFEAAAAKAGSLIELATHDSGALPVQGMRFDVVVWAAELAGLSESERTSRIQELLASLRPGGRAVVLDGAPTPRRFGGPRPLLLPSDAVISLLKAAGGLAARALASAGGLNYYETRVSR